MNTEELKKMIDEAPDECPITGLIKVKSYTIEDNVVYGAGRFLDVYTLPEYDEEDKCFYRTKYDMEDDCRSEVEHLCDLDELREREDFGEIKKFYNIVEEGDDA